MSALRTALAEAGVVVGEILDEQGRGFLKFFDLSGNMLVAHTG